MTREDTICAVATGMNNSGIGIIRLSGSRAIDIADSIFIGRKKISEMDTYTAAFGYVTGSDGSEIDETVVLVMRRPHSYTTEDTVEFDLHGGMLVIRKVLDEIVSKGARIAEPGEFTKRAFMGGRIDLSQAEAVMDIISAENDRALSMSVSKLRGSLRSGIEELRERIIYNTAYIESALDDPENYSLEGFSDRLKENVDNMISDVDRMIKTYDEGRIVRDGIRTAIVGRPNVGKSSILNMLLNEDRAIVTDIPGTTRDVLEETARLGGVTLRLVDTAGIRDTGDEVERIGVDKALKNIETAELVLMTVDSSVPFGDEDKDIMARLAGKRTIILLNKTDLTPVTGPDDIREAAEGMAFPPEIIEISALEGRGTDALRNAVEEMFLSGSIDYRNDVVITSERHRGLLIDAREALQRVRESIDAGSPEDFYTIDLMDAYEALGLIIGETLSDDLADKIFSEFCMGK